MRNFPRLLFKLNFWIILLIAVQVAAIIFLCVYIPSLMRVTLCLAAVRLISVLAAMLLFMRKGSPEVKCVWFAFIATFPLIGALMYLIASVRIKQQCTLKIHSAHAKGFDGAANAVCGTCAAEYAGAEYFSSGADFIKNALEAVKSAKKNVYIEFFIISRGHVFNALLNAIEQAKSNGADIKIILDGIGSAFRVGKKDIKRLKSAGAEVKIFNKLTPFPHARINLRDHRKIITVDGKTVFTGGINIADEYANITSPYGYWKDTGVAVHGQAAKVFEGMFLAMWNGKHEMQAPLKGEKNCLPFYDSPPDTSFAEDLFICAISSANVRVHIFTPYLCLSDKTVSALIFAAERGVDVKIIIPHIPDKKYAFEISKAFAYALSAHGIKVYEYTPGFLHAKSVICDNKVFMGSYNFDFRSTHFNYECGVMFDGGICDEVERDFEECLALSSKFYYGNPSKLKRLYIFILRFISPLV